MDCMRLRCPAEVVTRTPPASAPITALSLPCARRKPAWSHLEILRIHPRHYGRSGNWSPEEGGAKRSELLPVRRADLEALSRRWRRRGLPRERPQPSATRYVSAAA